MKSIKLFNHLFKLSRQKIVLTCFFPILFFNGIAQKKYSPIYYKYLKEKETLVAHYKNTGEIEKQKAAVFLFDNLKDHFARKCVWVNSQGIIYPYNELDYEDLEQATHVLDSLKKAGFSNALKNVWDVTHITAKYIRQTIDEAFIQWKKNPWSQNYDFDTFCEYILPYRNNDEPLTKGWQENYRSIFGNFKSNIVDPKDPVDVCNAMLLEMKHFEFLLRNDYPQPLLSAEQLLFRRKGSCPNLAHAALLAGRAFGLAVTNDYTPFFAASSSGHFWNAILDSNKTPHPFNGTDGGKLAIENGKRMGKVFRYTFSINPQNLTNFIPNSEIPYFTLRQKNYVDVTNQYMEVSDVTYQYKATLPYSIGYIMAYNYGKWKPLWWGKADTTGKVIFKDMGRNLVYLMAENTYSHKYNKKAPLLHFQPYPILLKTNGEQVLLKPNFKKTIACDLTRDNELELTYQDFNTVELINGTSFSLSYWDDGWKLVETQLVKNTRLSFKNLPTNALFQLLPESPDQFERNFIIEPTTCQIQWF